MCRELSSCERSRDRNDVYKIRHRIEVGILNAVVGAIGIDNQMEVLERMMKGRAEKHVSSSM